MGSERKPSYVMTYKVALRPDVTAMLMLPRDITVAEVARIKHLLDTLPIPEPEPADGKETT